MAHLDFYNLIYSSFLPPFFQVFGSLRTFIKATSEPREQIQGGGRGQRKRRRRRRKREGTRPILKRAIQEKGCFPLVSPSNQILTRVVVKRTGVTLNLLPTLEGKQSEGGGGKKSENRSPTHLSWAVWRRRPSSSLSQGWRDSQSLLTAMVPGIGCLALPPHSSPPHPHRYLPPLSPLCSDYLLYIFSSHCFRCGLVPFIIFIYSSFFNKYFLSPSFLPSSNIIQLVFEGRSTKVY